MLNPFEVPSTPDASALVRVYPSEPYRQFPRDLEALLVRHFLVDVHFFTYPISLSPAALTKNGFKHPPLLPSQVVGAVLLCHLAQSCVLRSVSVQLSPDAHTHGCASALVSVAVLIQLSLSGQFDGIRHDLRASAGWSWSWACAVTLTSVCHTRHHAWQRSPFSWSSDGHQRSAISTVPCTTVRDHFRSLRH